MSGELIRNTIEVAKTEIGVGRNMFALDYTLYHNIATDSWIKECWGFAHKHQINIIDKVTKNLSLYCQNDVFLMEVIAHHGFNKTELQKINQCWLYLQQVT
jgi:hypothetical protein